MAGNHRKRPTTCQAHTAAVTKVRGDSAVWRGCRVDRGVDCGVDSGVDWKLGEVRDKDVPDGDWAMRIDACCTERVPQSGWIQLPQRDWRLVHNGLSVEEQQWLCWTRRPTPTGSRSVSHSTNSIASVYTQGSSSGCHGDL